MRKLSSHGRAGGEIRASFHRRFDTQRLLFKKTARMGDEGKAAGCVSLAALLFEITAAGSGGDILLTQT
jgi:hypothetical protein